MMQKHNLIIPDEDYTYYSKMLQKSGNLKNEQHKKRASIIEDWLVIFDENYDMKIFVAQTTFDGRTYTYCQAILYFKDRIVNKTQKKYSLDSPFVLQHRDKTFVTVISCLQFQRTCRIQLTINPLDEEESSILKIKLPSYVHDMDIRRAFSRAIDDIVNENTGYNIKNVVKKINMQNLSWFAIITPPDLIISDEDYID